MRSLKRFLIAAAAPAALVAALVPGTASAAGLKVYIDDTASNNGSIACPGAVLTGDLSTQTFAANTTVYICPGTYTGELNITEDNVKVYGKGYPTITPGTGDTRIVDINTAQGFVVQGLVLDGADLFTVDYPSGIVAAASTGTITGNYLIRLRQYPVSTTCGGGAAVRIDNAPGAVKVVGNTIHDFQCHAITFFQSTSPLVQRNRVWGTSRVGIGNDGINAYDSTGVTISSNSISSDYDSEMSSQNFIAIFVDDTPGAKIVGNRINLTTAGVLVGGSCDGTVAGNPDNVQITGNQFNAVPAAVSINVQEFAANPCVSGANNISIKTNTFIYPRLLAWIPVQAYTSDDNTGDADNPSIAGLVLSGNKYTAGVTFFTPTGTGIVVAVNTKNTPTPLAAGQ